MKAQLVEELIRQWQWYAPNMTKDNIPGIYTNTPDDVKKRNINMLKTKGLRFEGKLSPDFLGIGRTMCQHEQVFLVHPFLQELS